MKLHGDFSYEENAEPALSGIELDVNQGDLIAVVGATGSGKTSLLSASIGLMEQESGPKTEVFGSVSSSLCLKADSFSRPAIF